MSMNKVRTTAATKQKDSRGFDLRASFSFRNGNTDTSLGSVQGGRNGSRPIRTTSE
jgi:hypothetical protein